MNRPGRQWSGMMQAEARRPEAASVHLPILDLPADHAPPRRARSRIARWRAATLILVHLLIIAHIVHWQVAGRTFGSLQLSEAMATLEGGGINPGFLLFGFALLVTAIFGRFFCGWACHMGALQDLCLWLMRRGGLRPAPFRTRLLPYLPVVIGAYMFLWPTAKRMVIAPLLEGWWPSALHWLGAVPAEPSFAANLATEDLWKGLPGPLMAIPFLLVCGAATVYFLGSRGFCRYACPYGGLFKPIERLAQGRIVVDVPRCDECGQCTAACTSNVRVLDELREHGTVVSAHCVRSLDCVSVCPQDALSYRVRSPARSYRGGGLAMETRRGDPTIAGEIVLLVVFAAVFFVTRGLYGAFPMLFAAGIGVCSMAITWKVWRMLRDRDARLHRFQLRRAGAITRAGWSFLGLVVMAGVLLGHSAMVRAMGWYAGALDDQVTVAREVVFTDPSLVPEPMRVRAGRALRYYQRASSWRYGGIGLALTPLHEVRAAWLHLVRGERTAAEVSLQRAIEREEPVDHLCAELGRIIIMRGDPARAERYLAATVKAHPAFSESLDLLVRLLMERGEIAEAIGHCRAHLERWPDRALTRAMLGRALFLRGEVAVAADALGSAMRELPGDPHLPRELAIALFETGDLVRALAVLEQARVQHPRFSDAYRELADALRREDEWRRSRLSPQPD